MQMINIHDKTHVFGLCGEQNNRIQKISWGGLVKTGSTRRWPNTVQQKHESLISVLSFYFFFRPWLWNTCWQLDEKTLKAQSFRLRGCSVNATWRTQKRLNWGMQDVKMGAEHFVLTFQYNSIPLITVDTILLRALALARWGSKATDTRPPED